VPSSSTGQQLIAHELAHSVQQHSAADISTLENISLAPRHSPQEDEAEVVSKNMVASAAQIAPPQIQRQPLDQQPDVIAQDKESEKEDAPDAEPTELADKKIAACDRTILSEGSCADLVAGSKWICCDPENGFTREGKKKDIDGTDCPSSKFTPIFTCDNNCEKALKKGCDDNDNWMALPGDSFSKAQCGKIFTICANGKKTTGYVRDKSERPTPFEVSPGIQKALGVPVGSSFKGAIYRPGASTKRIDADPCCNS
jgi:hypothetical protein